MTTLTRLDVDAFLKELAEYDSAKCESEHLGRLSGVWAPNSPCSIDAVASMTMSCTGVSTLWCQSRLDWYKSVREVAKCHYCRKWQSECWKAVLV